MGPRVERQKYLVFVIDQVPVFSGFFLFSPMVFIISSLIFSSRSLSKDFGGWLGVALLLFYSVFDALILLNQEGLSFCHFLGHIGGRLAGNESGLVLRLGLLCFYFSSFWVCLISFPHFLLPFLFIGCFLFFGNCFCGNRTPCLFYFLICFRSFLETGHTGGFLAELVSAFFPVTYFVLKIPVLRLRYETTTGKGENEEQTGAFLRRSAYSTSLYHLAATRISASLFTYLRVDLFISECCFVYVFCVTIW